MAAPQLTITKAEVIEQTGAVITSKEGKRARIMPRPSTMAHGFVFLAPGGEDWDEDFWRQFHVDLRGEPYNLVTGFGEDDYRPATEHPIALEIARQYSEAKARGVDPLPQQIELDPVRIKLK